LVFGYGGIALALARNIVLVPLYLRHISLGEYGAWLATGGALVQLLLTDLGLSGVVSQRVAHRLGASGTERLGRLIGAGLLSAAALGAVLFLVSVAIAPFLPATQGLSPEEVRRVTWCFVIAGLGNGLAFVSTTATGILRSLQRPISAGLVNLLSDLGSVIVTVVVLLGGSGLYALAVGMLARSVIGVGAGLGALAAAWIRIPALRPHASWPETVELWRASSKFFVTSLGMKAQSQANTLLVGSILGPHSAALYGLTVRAHETVLMLMAQFNAALAPSLAHLVGSDERERLRALVRRLLPLISVVAAIGFTLTATLNRTFVSLWVGPEAYGGAAVSVLMALALWTTTVSYIAYEVLIAHGEFGYISRVFVPVALLHLALLFVGVRFGMWAAPAAMVLSTLVLGAVFWRQVGREGGLTRRDVAAFVGDLAVVAAISVGTGVAFTLAYPVPATWVGLGVEGVACGSVLVALFWSLRPQLRRNVRHEWEMTIGALRPGG